MQRFKLGLKPWRDDPRHLRLSRYLTSALPAPNPSGVDWTMAMTQDWGMLGNDTQGDCFWAMAAHYFMASTANAGSGTVLFRTQDVLAAYHDCCGSGDTGTDPVVGLNYLRQTGMKDAFGGVHKLGAYVVVNQNNPVEVAQALEIFGPSFIGLSLPDSWESASLWDKQTDDGSTAGGHAVLGAGNWVTYPIPSIRIVTWGMDGVYLGNDSLDRVMMIIAMVSQDWISDTGLAPSGLDMKALLTDLNLVTV